jgi:hypothetical protein
MAPASQVMKVVAGSETPAKRCRRTRAVAAGRKKEGAMTGLRSTPWVADPHRPGRS